MKISNLNGNIQQKHHRDKNKNPVIGWILIQENPSLDLSQLSHSGWTLTRQLAEIHFKIIIKIHPITEFCLIN